MKRRIEGLSALAVALCASPSSFAPSARQDDPLPAVGTAGGPARPLSWREANRWRAGREQFTREHQERNGLGAPGFNAQSCAFCHKEPVVGGAGGPEVDVLTPRGTDGYAPRRGTGNQLAPMHERRRRLAERGQPLAEAFDVRQTPSLLGLGLIDSIPDDEILRNEDAHDANGDGVRGVASRVAVGGGTEVGRFGWKAEVPRLSDFACRALGGELGLTAPDQGRGFGLVEDGDHARDPELEQEALDDLAFFLANLAAPPRGEVTDSGLVQRGELLFQRLGCASCHVPVLYGNEGPVELYSDLLLHELGKPQDADSPGRSQALPAVRGRRVTKGQAREAAEAATPLFRTAPLWGVGKTAPYLHDGSAATLVEAVLAHDGEAAFGRDGYRTLVEQDQQALLAFLESL